MKVLRIEIAERIFGSAFAYIMGKNLFIVYEVEG
jgi:hypothetical protein